MNIAILGTGNVGNTLAADLTLKGNKVNLVKTSGNPIHNENFSKILKTREIKMITETGKEKIALINLVTKDIEAGIKDADIIIITIQTIYHEELIKKLVPFLKDQIIMMLPGYLSTYLFKKYMGDNFNECTFVECESSTIDCRIISPGVVRVLFENVRNPIAVFPSDRTEKIAEKLKGFGYNYFCRENIIETALHNPNLIVHTIGGLMSIPRIEYSKGKYSMYREVFTPTVWKLVEGLDQEKKDILSRMNFAPIAYVDACCFRNSEDLNIDSKEIFVKYANNSAPEGPNVSNSRFITEDVPEGLVLMESIGKLLKIETPITTSLIDLANTFMGKEYRKVGRTLERLGVKELQM